MASKIRVAVLFGGLSSEHDVSVCTGLEALQALDPNVFEGFPVYIGLDGQWWVGDALRDIKSYLPDAAVKRTLTRVAFCAGNAREKGAWVLRAVNAPMFGKAQVFPFDVALPTLHGTWGEDGTLQGLLAAEGVPMACGGVGPLGLTINKMWTLHEAMVREIPVLSSMLVRRGDELDAATATKALGKFPLFIKPNTLGSSMGAHKVDNEEELQAALADVFRLDTAALVQPCVPNLVEYNVAVRRKPDGTVVTSAIERPLRKGELLSFEDKYAHSGTNKLTSANSGMATMDRVLNPPELGMRAVSIRTWAEQLFVGLELSGAPRLDFLCNEKTGDIWFNEINPIPGGLGWFLWGAAPEAISFTDLLTDMVTEAQARTRTHARVVDPVSTGGAIFSKRG